MFPWRSILTLVVATQLVACATIINGSTERIEVAANVSDTRVYVNDVFIGQAGPQHPLRIEIPKRGLLTFTGKKENCSTAETKIVRRLDPVTFLGLILDMGLITIIVVDWLGTNAIYRSSYQNYYLNLGCTS